MLTGEGSVTRVGKNCTQFYIPRDVSSDSTYPFRPDDPFTVLTVPGLGLLLTKPSAELPEIIEALQETYDD